MHTWDDATAAWKIDKHYKTTIAQDAAKFDWLQPHFGGLPLEALDRDKIMLVARLKAHEASPATANRFLSLIRAVLRRAFLIWKWVPSIPRIELFPEKGGRVRWIDAGQVRTLLDNLPHHQQLTVTFALATGLRQANVINLEWSQVDLRRKVLTIFAHQAKSRKDFSIPLNETAMDVLQRCRGVHPVRVFTYLGRPFSEANTRAWRRALKRSGIKDFRWHDLRHTWASWHVQNGTPLFVVQDLGAWSSEQMVRRYAHLAPPQYAQYSLAIDNVINAE